MSERIRTDLIERITPLARDLMTERAPSLPGLRYADMRIEIGEAKFATSENGAPRSSGEDQAFSFGVRVLAGSRMVAAGHYGRGLGAAVLSTHAVQKELKAGRLRALHVTGLPLRREMYVAWDRRRVLPIPARLFLDLLDPCPKRRT